MRNSTVADCFSSGIIWCAAFIVRNKFEQLIKEGSRFIFSILYFSGTIAISTFLSDKRKLSFPRYSQVDLLGEKYLWNCTTHNNGLELIKLTITSSSAFHQHTSFNFYENGYFVLIPFVRLFSKPCRCQVSCGYHVYWTGAAFCNLCFCFLALFIKLFVSFSYHIFCLPLPRSESRTTVFYSVRAMGHLPVIARVLTLSFVVFGRTVSG